METKESGTTNKVNFRVLHVIGVMNCGGAEAMIMNLYRNIDRNKIQFDFVVHEEEPGFYNDEIRKLGGKIYKTKRYWGYNFLSYKNWWNHFFESHPEYLIVHGHIGSCAAIYLHEAKRHGRIAIAHSHSTKTTDKDLQKYLWELNSWPTRKIADYFFACSSQAAMDRYGRKVTSSNRCIILKNSIDYRRFSFDQNKRKYVREQLKLQNFFVIGHVGRFTSAKNHVFLLKIFAEIHKMDKSARLLLVGTGELEENIKKDVRDMQMDEFIIFAGVHKNIEDYYCAMDVFCFPSKWEGLGMVLVEAQANGLMCLTSDAIPEEADIGANLFESLSLNLDPYIWAQKLISWRDKNREIKTSQFVINAGYDSHNTAKLLENFYKKLYCKRYINIQSNMLETNAIDLISQKLNVSINDIKDIKVLKKGMTNRSFLFTCHNKKYIVRVPGEGTAQLIDRKKEAAVYKAINGKELCDEIVYINPKNGYKITKYMENARVCNPLDDDDLKKCMSKLRDFHEMRLSVEHEFDVFAQIEFYEHLRGGKDSVYTDYSQVKKNVFSLKSYIEDYVEDRVLAHIDAVPDNFLFIQENGKEYLRLIDWEYAGMQDPHIDIAMFCIYSLYNKQQVDNLINFYFVEGCPDEIKTKIYCYIAVCGLLWSNWCEYKKQMGVEFGEYASRQYLYAKDYYEIVQSELRKKEEIQNV